MQTPSSPVLETDYLVIGSGAMGMAFVDTLLQESTARVVMVDRHLGPGGHWNDAYPFVRLHQPSALYGVNSRALGSDALEGPGFNEGLYERATAAELVSYYQQVMQDFVRSGRVQYFPMCDYAGQGKGRDAGQGEGDGLHRFQSRVSGHMHRVQVRKKLVDSTYFNTAVPSTHPPSYSVEPGVQCIAPNDLPRAAAGHSGYVVIGAGKTGLDTCLWLLENGADPHSITWIMPRDAWHYNRATVFEAEVMAQQWLASDDAPRLDDSAADREKVGQFFLAAERAGYLLRMDPSVEPGMFHSATVSVNEWHALRKLPNIVRLGRVQHIAAQHITLERGSLPSDARRLYIDCSTSAIQRRPTTPVFQGARLTLQMLRWPAPSISAALIARLEAHGGGDARNNALSTPLYMPDAPADWLRLGRMSNGNLQAWLADPGLLQWLVQSRLSGFAMMAQTDAPPV